MLIQAEGWSRTNLKAVENRNRETTGSNSVIVQINAVIFVKDAVDPENTAEKRENESKRTRRARRCESSTHVDKSG